MLYHDVMGALMRSMRRVPPVVRAVLALAAGWAFSVGVLDRQTGWIRHWLNGHGWLDAEIAFANLQGVFRQSALDPLLFFASFAVPVALLVRMVARARVRAGLPDPLDRVREWTAAHSKLTRAALALPAVAWFASPTRHVVYSLLYGHGLNMRPAADVLARLGMPVYAYFELFVCVMAVTSLGVYSGMKSGLRAFLSPTVGPEGASAKPDERIGFDAVAVTAETRTAVALMALLSVVTVVVMQSANLRSTGVQAWLAAYVAVAVAGVVAFRRASRVAVGVDGVFVTGTSRSRFVAYKDLESVRARRSDIELLHRGRVILRLQLHGEDATQRDAIVARIAEAIEKAKAQATAALGEIVGAVSEDQLARLAEGARGYRTQSVTRAELWSLVEGPEHDAQTRTAAARALVTTGDANEKTRLRVAAGKSAEPRVRVALEGLAAGDVDASGDQEDVAPVAALRARG
jgi:hypothetical protein